MERFAEAARALGCIRSRDGSPKARRPPPMQPARSGAVWVRSRRATPEEARTATGFAVGGTPPFGHPARVRTFCDGDLLAHDEVWAAAGTPDSVFPLTPADLVRLSGATVIDLATR